jgi:hypothetical protein
MELVWIGLGLVAIGTAAIMVFWPWLKYDNMEEDRLPTGIGGPPAGALIGFICLIALGLGLLVYAGIRAFTGG